MKRVLSQVVASTRRINQRSFVAGISRRLTVEERNGRAEVGICGTLILLGTPISGLSVHSCRRVRCGHVPRSSHSMVSLPQSRLSLLCISGLLVNISELLEGAPIAISTEQTDRPAVLIGQMLLLHVNGDSVMARALHGCLLGGGHRSH